MIIAEITAVRVSPAPVVGVKSTISADARVLVPGDYTCIWIFQVKNPRGIIVLFKEYPVSITRIMTTFTGRTDWTPTESGVHTVEAYLWKSFVEPIPYAHPKTITVSVAPAVAPPPAPVAKIVKLTGKVTAGIPHPDVTLTLWEGTVKLKEDVHRAVAPTTSRTLEYVDTRVGSHVVHGVMVLRNVFGEKSYTSPKVTYSV